LGHGGRTADLTRRACNHGRRVGTAYDGWVQQREKSVEVTTARSGKEGVDDLSMAGEIGVRHLRSLYPAACTAGELPGGGRGASHDGTDLVEGDGEHVVQDEGEPLCRSQGLENHQQRRADRVGQECFVLGVVPVPEAHDRVGRWALIGSSRRDLRERNMSRETLATAVVSHPPRFSTSLVSEQLSRSHASWTASSASLSEPSIP